MSANRAILLTPPGVAAIAVIRLTGPRSLAFLQSHFSKPPRSRICVRGNLHDHGTILDDAVLVQLDADRFDLCLHGGAWIVQSAQLLLQREGFVWTNRPGFAIEAGGVLENEVRAALPGATTELALRMLLAQPMNWKNVTPDQYPQIAADFALWRLLHPPRVAIIGLPNVGKSTLANQLFARERSIVADMPGTTRDWVGASANIDGLPISLIDTPGIRQSEDEIESTAIAISVAEVKSTDLVIVVIDAASELGPQQALINEYPIAMKIINRVDRAGKWPLSQVDAIHTIATTGSGLDEVRGEILKRFGIDTDLSKPRWWTQRQRREMRKAFLPQMKGR